MNYWLSTDAIRLERDGQTWLARLRGDGSLSWLYGRPDEASADAALGILRYDADPEGWDYQGAETIDEMDRQVAARCLACRVVQASILELSDDGHCPRCWVAGMAVSP